MDVTLKRTSRKNSVVMRKMSQSLPYFYGHRISVILLVPLSIAHDNGNAVEILVAVVAPVLLVIKANVKKRL